MSEPDRDETAHAEKMRKIQAARARMLAEKTVEKGLVIVHTGAGKGKSSAALGMVFRHIAHELPVAVVQFGKSPEWETGEAKLLRRFPDLCRLEVLGAGFTWDTQSRSRDVAAAEAAWAVGQELIRSGAYRLVLLDELNIALRYGHIDAEAVTKFLREERPEHVHVVITGRNAPAILIELADLVTEMSLIKHPFRAGVKAQAGIEY